MTKKRTLTAFEKAGVLGILAVGCSRETAAIYAKCSRWKLKQAIAEDATFATEVIKAEQESEVFFVDKIRKAANKEQYWRAAAWALERRFPNRYAARGAGTLTMDQVKQLVSRLSDIVVQEIPGGSERRRILKRIHELVKTGENDIDDTPIIDDDISQESGAQEPGA
jgi:hypothetical protein